MRYPSSVPMPSDNWRNGAVPPTMNGNLAATSKPVMLPIRVCCLLFIFSVPFEDIDLFGIATVFSLVKMAGFLLAIVALLQPKKCYGSPPKAFWCFAGFWCIWVARGLLQTGSVTSGLSFTMTIGQDIIAFLICCNIIRCSGNERAVLAVLAVSNAIVAALGHFGIAAVEESVGAGQEIRRTAIGWGANYQGYLYAMGLVATVGLMMGRWKNVRWLVMGLPLLLLLAAELAHTGSRGAMLAAGAAIIAFAVGSRGLGGRIKGAVVAGVVFAIFLWLVIHTGVSYERWNQTITTQYTSGRQNILTEATGMFLEKPILGWGPGHLAELSLRTRQGDTVRDTHNDLLYVLTATGLAGGVFFLSGWWFCLRNAWRARGGRIGPAALALMVVLIVNGMSNTLVKKKPSWMIMALAAGCATEIVSKRPRSSQRLLAQPQVRRT
jgi:O-antigen ligase